MSLKSKMGELKKMWNTAKKTKPEFESSAPDGVYVGRIVKAEFGEAETSGRPQVSWGAVISAGEFKGETVRWWSGLKTEQNMMYLQRDIVRLGHEVDDLDELEDVLAKIEKEKPSIRFRIKTDGEFTNIRVLKKLAAGETEDEEPAATKEPEDPAPEAEEDPIPETEPEPEPEPAEADEPTLEVGVRAAFDLKGKEVVGEVTKVNDDETVVVKLDNGGGSFKVKVEKLRPAAKTKVKKK